MKKILIIIAGVFFTETVIAQVGINTQNPDPSSALEISSTDQGFLPPRLNYDQTKAINNPAQGLIVYCTDCMGPQGTLVIFNGEIWSSISYSTHDSGLNEVHPHDPEDEIPSGFDIFDPNPEVFDNPVSNNVELELMLSKANDLLTSYAYMVMLAEIASDNSVKGGESYSDLSTFNDIEDFVYNPTNSAILNVWNFMYAGYNRASYAYHKGAQIQDVFPAYLSEALFLKSFYAYNLIEWFGHYPSIDGYDDDNKPVLVNSDLSHRTEKLYEVIDMLYTAISIAESDGVTSSGRSTIDKNIMLSFIAKSFVKMGDYGNAFGVTQQIISSGQYGLNPNYQNIFDFRTESSVFDIDCTDAQYASWECTLCTQGNWMSGFQGIRSYNGPEFRSGYGFNIPTQESYDSFELSDIRRDVALLDISDWIFQNPTASFSQGFQHTGFFNKKYLPRQGGAELNHPQLTYGNDLKVIRYAEILLLHAETSLRVGNGYEAAAYLNQVRNRAGLSSIGYNDVSIDHIIQERRSEFMGEGKRFFDLVRFGIASQYISYFQNGVHEVFPIPRDFIDSVGDLIVQNPGY